MDNKQININIYIIKILKMNQGNEIRITIPDSWQDITISQFQEYIDYVKNSDESKPLKKLIQILSILTDTDEAVLYKLDYDSIYQIKDSMSFIEEEPTVQFKNIVDVNGVKYGFQKDMHKLSLGEWIDIEHYVTQRDIIENLHYIAAIFYRKITKEGDEYFDYEIEDYGNVRLEGQAKFFKHNMKLVDMYGTVVFFYHIVNEFLNSMTYSSITPTQEMMMEKVEMLIERIKDSKLKKIMMQKIEKNPLKNGVGNFLSTLLLEEI